MGHWLKELFTKLGCIRRLDLEESVALTTFGHSHEVAGRHFYAPHGSTGSILDEYLSDRKTLAEHSREELKKMAEELRADLLCAPTVKATHDIGKRLSDVEFLIREGEQIESLNATLSSEWEDVLAVFLDRFRDFDILCRNDLVNFARAAFVEVLSHCDKEEASIHEQGEQDGPSSVFLNELKGL